MDKYISDGYIDQYEYINGKWTHPKHKTYEVYHLEENWTVELSECFYTLEEAKNYVIRMSLADIVCYSSRPTTKFCREFCFTDDRYLANRSYFIGNHPDDVSKIKLESSNRITTN